MHLRAATIEDEPAILALVPRLVEFGPPAWRDPQQLIDVDRATISSTLRNPVEGAVILVAEIDTELAGFIHLCPLTDYSETPHGHVSDIVVEPSQERRGVGRALLAAAEQWAKDKGYRWLTISVFDDNKRAAEIYQRSGFGRDILRLVKPL